jgi:penicillin-binding protein 1A
MWIQFMRVALANKPEHSMPMPPDIVTEKIDPNTGLLAADGQPNAIEEYFKSDNVPQQTARANNNEDDSNQDQANDQNGNPLF